MFDKLEKIYYVEQLISLLWGCEKGLLSMANVSTGFSISMSFFATSFSEPLE